ncbi:hypothetical protein V8B97DRAFT_2084205 [Scleroderma yunnanense]
MALAVEEPIDCSLYTKGKGKASLSEQPTESTPLLQIESDSSQSSGSSDDALDPESAAVRQRLYSTLTIVFFASLSFCLLAFVAIVLVVYSFTSRLSDVSPQDLLDNGLQFQGPSRIDVLNATDGGLWINVDARVGIDAGFILGVNSEGDEGPLKGAWKSIGRLGIRLMRTVSADVSEVYVYSSRQALLATVSADPLELPITTNPPHDASWLTPVSVTLFVRPTNSSSDLTKFVEDVWHDRTVSVHTLVSAITVWGGQVDRKSWRSKFTITMENLETQVTAKLPSLPGLPTSDDGTSMPPFTKLVSLQSFNIASSSKGLTLEALATAVNPVPPTLVVTVPRLPFTIYLPGAQDTLIPIASVFTEPFSLTKPNVTVLMSGHVLPLGPDAAEPLSTFVSHYLSLRHNPISIASPAFPSLILNGEFPSPPTRPHILRNVTIRDMKIKPEGTIFVASGQVFARLVLPKGMNFTMDVNKVFPDLLVFDGEVPDPTNVSTIHDPFPDPLPPRAFGHICPEEWLNATSTYDGSEEGGSAFLVTASIVDVPIEMLPGREKEFSNFVSKVIFSSKGAVAGLLGTADITIHVVGLPFSGGNNSEFMLKGLPLQGTVRIGKKFGAVINP